jgi:hypothetical protein
MRHMSHQVGCCILIAGCFLANPAQSADRAVGSWAVRNTKDPITDKPFVVVQTPLDNRGADYLKIDCEDGKPYIAVGLKDVVWHRKEDVEVELRIDKGEVTTSSFSTIIDDRLIVSGLSRETYAKLSIASVIAVQAVSTDGRTWQAVFKGSKTAQAMKPMLAACPLDAAPSFKKLGPTN